MLINWTETAVINAAWIVKANQNHSAESRDSIHYLSRVVAIVTVTAIVGSEPEQKLKTRVLRDELFRHIMASNNAAAW